MMSESEKFVMITGCAGGIGRACVSRFFRQGWRVIGIDKTNFGEGFPQNGLFIKADISQPDQFPDFYKKSTHSLRFYTRWSITPRYRSRNP